ncbi:unnamed protein product [Strongylus vulgaris]|uniref:Uncharacterized protein n=1 Tax=Strongylus vulgaris TaxID=40348 RepID=A0A3P7J0D7_STRVU|nr:unnamed protein product [Strongylus vulgaris]
MNFELERATVKAGDGSLITVDYLQSDNITTYKFSHEFFPCCPLLIPLLACMVFRFQLKRATVQNAVTGDLEPADYRISKSAWLKEEDHEVVARVNRRIEDMTNLNQKTSEDLQNCSNMGIRRKHLDNASTNGERAGFSIFLPPLPLGSLCH